MQLRNFFTKKRRISSKLETLFAIILGLAIMAGFSLVLPALTKIYFTRATLLNQGEISNLQSFITSLVGLVSSLSPIGAGIVMGWRLNKKAWLFGALTGLLMSALGIVVLVFMRLNPDLLLGKGLGEYPPEVTVMALKRVEQSIIGVAVGSIGTMIQVGLGGFVGAYLKKNKSSTATQETVG